jgi:hypothetical protein
VQIHRGELTDDGKEQYYLQPQGQEGEMHDVLFPSVSRRMADGMGRVLLLLLLPLLHLASEILSCLAASLAACGVGQLEKADGHAQ